MTHKDHINKWRNGCGSCYCESATKIVYGRGHSPCDLLFVGEAPGDSENVLGIPFCGPAGRLLDDIISKALCPEIARPSRNDWPLRVAFTNLLGCIPYEMSENGAIEKSKDIRISAIKQCKPRLLEFIQMVNPIYIICVGRLSGDHLTHGDLDTVQLPRFVAMDSITHPAAILRAPLASRELSIKRCIIRIQETIQVPF